MAVLSPPYALGAAGQVLSGRLLRQNIGAMAMPLGAGITTRSGCIVGPTGQNGEVTLPTPTTCTVQPFRAVVQNTQDLTAGPALVTNDAAVTLAVTAQHATQFRKSLVLIEVNDSQTAGVGSSGTTDRARLYPLDGALAATSGAAALPALPANSLALGEILIPPTGQTVTLTPYNPRTVIRGEVYPVTDEAARLAIPSADRYPGLEVLALSTGRVWLWNGTKWLFSTGPIPTCVVRRTTTTGGIVGQVWTPTIWELMITADTTDTSMWSAAQPTRMIAPIDGIYHCSGIGSIAQGHGNLDMFTAFRKGSDGLSRRSNSLGHITNQAAEVQSDTTMKLAAGDYVEFLLYISVAGTLNFIAAGVEITPRFEMTWIGNS